MNPIDLHKERFLRVCIDNVETQFGRDDSLSIFMNLFSINPFPKSTVIWGILQDITRRANEEPTD